MIQLVGIKKNVDIDIREKLSISSKNQEVYTKELLKFFNEVVIISTCNRTEIYLNGDYIFTEGLEKIFNILNWDINLMEYCFCLREEETVKHIMEVVCGFHSRIIGENQILGQIKLAYQQGLKLGALKTEMQRLFQDTLACGKKFRTEGKLYEIPVSSSSIAVNKAIESGAKTLMVIGYGEVGKLVVKYALAHGIEELKLVVRNVDKVLDIEDKRVEVMTYDKGRDIINDMNCVISCTSAPHLIIEDRHIHKEGKPLIIFDLALPRDISESIGEYSRVTLMDIDDISALDDENKKLRQERMKEYRYIPNEYMKEFLEWKNIRDISEDIKKIKLASNDIVEERYKAFYNRCKNRDDAELAKSLMKSTSDAYVNRAIEILKEEKLKGSEKECLRILKRIFIVKN